MSATCPNGHTSQALDYCDTCGAPMGAAIGAAGSGAAGDAGASGGSGGSGATGGASGAEPATCPHCGTDNVPGALFCEACGYDFTTGALPRGVSPTTTSPGQSAAPAASGAPGPGSPGPGSPPSAIASPAPAIPVEWVTERWVDPEWHAAQVNPEPCPSPGLPVVEPLRSRSMLIGRPSTSRRIDPDIDCTPDTAVSRRHAQLTTDGTRWWIEDLQSSNGTFVGPDSGPLPTNGLAPGIRHELHEGDRVYVGAWTRLVLRRATDQEKS